MGLQLPQLVGMRLTADLAGVAEDGWRQQAAGALRCTSRLQPAVLMQPCLLVCIQQLHAARGTAQALLSQPQCQLCLGRSRVLGRECSLV